MRSEEDEFFDLFERDLDTDFLDGYLATRNAEPTMPIMEGHRVHVDWSSPDHGSGPVVGASSTVKTGNSGVVSSQKDTVYFDTPPVGLLKPNWPEVVRSHDGRILHKMHSRSNIQDLALAELNDLVKKSKFKTTKKNEKRLDILGKDGSIGMFLFGKDFIAGANLVGNGKSMVNGVETAITKAKEKGQITRISFTSPRHPLADKFKDTLQSKAPSIPVSYYAYDQHSRTEGFHHFEAKLKSQKVVGSHVPQPGGSSKKAEDDADLWD
jgi:hypothetical protein